MSKREIDDYSYQAGVIDCFNEMVHAGVKTLAMSHPCSTKEERDAFLPFCEEICSKYQTKYYPEDEAFLTDLFPEELNRGKYNILFYRTDEVLEAYLALKKEQKRLKQENGYTQEERRRIAAAFGRMLSYTDEAVARLIYETQNRCM